MRETSESSRNRDHARSKVSMRAAIAARRSVEMGSAVSICQPVPMASKVRLCGRVSLDLLDCLVESAAGQGRPADLVDLDRVDVLADDNIGDARDELALVLLGLLSSCDRRNT